MQISALRASWRAPGSSWRARSTGSFPSPAGRATASR
ncbi:CRISPR-associated protein Cas5 [Streptomyces sp. NPDC058385]